MKLAGSLLMLAGITATLFAFMMDTTVSSSGSFIGGSYIGGGSTYNLGLLQQQMMVLQSGLAAFVAGAFLYGSGQGTAEAASSNATVRRNWMEARDDESEEERDERVRRVKRLNMIMIGAIAGIIILLVLAVNWPSSSSDQNGIMNVDEKLTTTDMNVDENLTATDMNSL